MPFSVKTPNEIPNYQVIPVAIMPMKVCLQNVDGSLTFSILTYNYFVAAVRVTISNVMVVGSLRWVGIINCQNSAGDTPLHVISRNDALSSLVPQMVAAGADTTIGSSVGSSQGRIQCILL